MRFILCETCAMAVKMLGNTALDVYLYPNNLLSLLDPCEHITYKEQGWKV